MKTVPVIQPLPAAPTPAAVQTLPANLRRFLYLTSALTGAAILIVEILGAKMLSPYVGTSHFVWTAQITVTLVALATGYYLGGWLADRSPGLDRMYVCILGGAIYLCATVPLCRSVAYACLEFRLAVGSLLAALFLFFVPLTLLATVGPFLVRNFTRSVDSVGGMVGRLSAISTLGSVGGTLLIGYVLIPHLPNSMTMYLTAITLMTVVVLYWFGVRPQPAKSLAKALVVVGLFAGLATGFAGVHHDVRVEIPNFEELERRNSNFGEMIVIQHTNQLVRYYLNDFLTQNTYDPMRKQSLSMFTYMLHGLARTYTPKLERALCIGLGVGIVPMALAKDGVSVDVVEINPAMVGVAQRHFNLEPDKLHILIEDGRPYLNRCTNRYDAVVLDAFLGDSSPSHLMTREAFQAMKQVLNPNGTLVINSFGDLTPGNDFFTASLERTLQSVFASVKIHTSTHGNVLFVASDRKPLEFVRQPDLTQVHDAAIIQTEAAYRTVAETQPGHGRILTDDFNPVEFYDAKNREDIRRSLAFRMRDKDSD
ncbi:MAG: fused MFS/spermidine synthase [Verrucomicrobiota bacterium]